MLPPFSNHPKICMGDYIFHICRCAKFHRDCFQIYSAIIFFCFLVSCGLQLGTTERILRYNRQIHVFSRQDMPFGGFLTIEVIYVHTTKPDKTKTWLGVSYAKCLGNEMGLFCSLWNLHYLHNKHLLKLICRLCKSESSFRHVNY